MTKRHLVIATRESPLAMVQAQFVQSALETLHPGLRVSLLPLTTQGDRRQEVALRQIGGKGLFVKELEEALLDGRADLAVHSMKDMPMVLPPGLALPVMCQREEVRDVLVSNAYPSLMSLPPAAKVGTASLRRQTQLLALRSDLIMQDLRGNVQTRLRRLDEGDFDAIILAGAGLIRMGLQSRITAYLSTDDSLPAAGQGALGLECRADDKATLALIQPLNHERTFQAVSAERAVCAVLQGGCQVPIAAYATVHRDRLHCEARVMNAKGTRILKAALAGGAHEAVSIGERVGQVLLQQGAADILKAFTHE
ncbi:MAG TPA: hydroxymethylbilane synthase [Gammaproteobacteria bacterium]|nr:hydroxymethylbilane synthase [Gammaproteobacteria bacterium]